MITSLLISQGLNCLILDNLSSLAYGLDENKGADYECVAHWLLELRRRKITVIFVHHAGRNGLVRGHSKREDACSWILELKDAKIEGEPGAKFLSHFAKPSRNSGKSEPDIIWHFMTDAESKTKISWKVAAVSEFDQCVRQIFNGVERVTEIAAVMGKNKGTVSKWVNRAVEEGIVRRDGQRVIPVGGPTEG